MKTLQEPILIYKPRTELDSEFNDVYKTALDFMKSIDFKDHEDLKQLTDNAIRDILESGIINQDNIDLTLRRVCFIYEEDMKIQIRDINKGWMYLLVQEEVYNSKFKSN